MKTRNENAFAKENFNFEALTPGQMGKLTGQGGTEEYEYRDENGNYVYRIVIKR